MEQTDEQLITLYIDGDDTAFDSLVRRHTNAVYGFVIRLVRRQADAEDVVQNTFIKAWKHIDSFNVNMNFRTWLFTIARNTAFDLARKRKVFAFSEFDTDTGDNVLVNSLATDEDTAIEHMMLEEDAEVVRAALATLSPAHQEILHLRYGEDLTFEEISQVVKKPMNTVKSQARRGLIELKRILTKGAPHKTP
jgi:RNA polymerase sigma-70 factor (ECF subfamily)